jgi:hypothetical protein
MLGPVDDGVRAYFAHLSVFGVEEAYSLLQSKRIVAMDSFSSWG